MISVPSDAVSDIILLVTGESNAQIEFHVHKYPLANASSFFSQLFKTDTKLHVYELKEFPDYSFVFEKCVRIMYGWKEDLQIDSVVRVLYGLQFLGVKQHIMSDVIGFFNREVLSSFENCLKALSGNSANTCAMKRSGSLFDHDFNPRALCFSVLSKWDPVLFKEFVRTSFASVAALDGVDFALIVKLMLRHHVRASNDRADFCALSTIVETLILYLQQSRLPLYPFLSLVELLLSDPFVLSTDSLLGLMQLLVLYSRNEGMSIDSSDNWKVSDDFCLDSFIAKLLLELGRRLEHDHEWIYAYDLPCVFSIVQVSYLFETSFRSVLLCFVFVNYAEWCACWCLVF